MKSNLSLVAIKFIDYSMIIGSKLTKTTDFDWKPFLSSLSDLSEYDEAIRKKKQLLLLLLLSHFSHVRLCATPRTAAYQAPPSLGFSRQEHWSGLPFPSPMHESEKWKWSRLAVSDPQRPHGLQTSRLLRTWDFPGKSTGVGCHCLLQGLDLSKVIFNYPQ